MGRFGGFVVELALRLRWSGGFVGASVGVRDRKFRAVTMRSAIYVWDGGGGVPIGGRVCAVVFDRGSAAPRIDVAVG